MIYGCIRTEMEIFHVSYRHPDRLTNNSSTHVSSIGHGFFLYFIFSWTTTCKVDNRCDEFLRGTTGAKKKNIKQKTLWKTKKNKINTMPSSIKIYMYNTISPGEIRPPGPFGPRKRTPAKRFPFLSSCTSDK